MRLRPTLWAALAVVCCCNLSGCRLYDRTDESAGYDQPAAYDQPQYDPYVSQPASQDTPARLEQTWGPGEYAALLTGTVGSKDRNFFLNVPLASWYVREQDRKGVGVLGGALAYDMVTVQRENGAPVSEKLTSHGLLGLAGNITERSLNGSGDYTESHWFFPFYRYYNRNGERTVYPLMLFPWTLRPKTPPIVAYDPAPWNRAGVAPLDPPPVEARTTIGDTSITAGPPRTVQPASEWAYDLTRVEPPVRPRRTVATPTVTQPVRTTNNTGVGTLRPRTTAAVPSKPVKKRTRTTAIPPRQYQVKKGDTLYGIARRFYGNGKEWQRILDANRSAIPSNEKALPVGLALVIPQ
ncbi:MAG: LysM peptidoglycan-binding domain-containing protein [Planctomycetota bacterium]